MNRKKKKIEKSFWKVTNWLKGISDVQEIYNVWTVGQNLLFPKREYIKKKKKDEESFWKNINWLKGISDIREMKYDIWTSWTKFIILKAWV